MKKDFNQHQINFFDEIKSLPNTDGPLPIVISEILTISIDSAYRRIRGETPLIMPEIVKICDYFDTTFSYSSTWSTKNELTFYYKSLSNDKQPLIDLFSCLNVLYQNLLKLKQNGNFSVYLSFTDVPIIYLYKYRSLIDFRIKTWFKEMTGNDVTKDKEYNSQIDNLLTILEEIYCLIDSSKYVKVWSSHTLDAFLGSVAYYNQINDLSDSYQTIFDELNLLLDDSYYKAGDSSNGEMYYTEMEMSNGYLLAEGGSEGLSLIKMFSINSIISFDKTLFEDIKLWMDLIISNSVLISRSNKKQRHIYFSNLRKQVEKVQKNLNIATDSQLR